jgi:membrane protein implicated in regulation of membrane protease activity
MPLAPSTILVVASVALASVARAAGTSGPVMSWTNEFGMAAHVVVVVLLFWTLRLHRVLRSRRVELEARIGSSKKSRMSVEARSKRCS